MLRLLRSEIFRLRKRWMPWILLGMIVLLAFVAYELIWVSSNIQLQLLRSGNAPASPTGLPPEALIKAVENTIDSLRPARLTEAGLSVVTGLGSILLIVFSASHVGTEWAWGTLRTVLASGASRGGFLVSKYASLIGFALLYTIVGVTAMIGASFVVATQAGLDTSGLDVEKVAASAARGLYGYFPYMSLASLIALWFRSAGGGIAAGLVINFTESIVAGLLISFNKDFASIANFGLSRNVQSLARVGAPAGSGPTTSVIAPLPDPVQAAVVLAVWTAIFVALAFWRLRSRDITLA